jgi:ubiquinone/menaquinone biosynthesis C-methylase UbiE
MKVLDAGCGPEILTEAISPYVDEIVAYDLTPEMIEATRKKCENVGLQNVFYATGKIESILYEDNFFDSVISCLMFYHLPDLLEGFREILSPKERGKVHFARYM